MKINRSFWASTALLLVPSVLAESTETSATFSTTTSTAPSCTASLITTLCEYTEPGPEFAVAIESRDSCLDYCNEHPPCDFVIFAAGNPYTGTGTCWVYPGETFDASAGNTDCGNPYLSVYGKPVCTGTPTATPVCAATSTPSAITSVCGYPTPDDCFTGCIASSGAVDCLKSCVEADSCSYVVFNPRNPSNSPYASGTCWVYPNGTYVAEAATSCSEGPEQFVYTNPCPGISSSSSPLSPATTSGSETASGTSSATAVQEFATNDENSAPATAVSLSVPIAVGLIILLWQGRV
ncbi:hypothetical protein S40293_08851 [Stachybotrys chartarum IBT 40293]|nr:hypothetical protein S40293_08851 [Stachybotrys chartarum IBT 40293]